MSQKIFEEINICDLCKYDKPDPFLTAPDRNYQSGIFKYIKCPRCSLIWLSPRPKSKVLSRYYPKIYRAHLGTEKASQLQLLIRKLIYKNNLVAKIFIKDQLFFWQKKGKILDVGTGNGKYLEILRGWGWDSYGLEISKDVVKEAQKNGIKNIEEGVLLTSKYPNSSFDVIRFSHVMEHVPSPRKELIKTHQLLKKNGKVVILIPNIQSLFFKVFKTYWYPLDPPRHFYHYTPQTIEKYLGETGFKEIEIKFTQSPYTFIRSLQYLSGKKRVEKRYGLLVYPLAFLMRVLDILKTSDVMEVIATKK